MAPRPEQRERTAGWYKAVSKAVRIGLFRMLRSLKLSDLHVEGFLWPYHIDSMLLPADIRKPVTDDQKRTGAPVRKMEPLPLAQITWRSGNRPKPEPAQIRTCT